MMLMRLWIAVAGCLLASAATAAPLAERVPANALFYMGWQGSEALTEPYERSHLKAVVDASQMELFLEQFLTQLERRMAIDDAQAAVQMAHFQAVARTVWRYPTALYATVSDAAGGGHVVLLCEAGEDQTPVMDRFRTMFLSMPNGATAVVDGEDGLVIVALLGGEAAAEAAKAATAGQVDVLPQAARFGSAMRQVQAQSALTVFIDANAVLAWIGDHTGDKTQWAAMQQSLGLDGLKSVAWTSGFGDKDWVTRMFIEAPQPRRGLLAIMDAPPLSEALLKSVPRSASMVGASRMDLQALWQVIHKAATDADPQTGQQLNEMMMMASAMTGMDIVNQLMPALGDEWVYYTDRRTAGSGLLGVVVVHRPRDAQALEHALATLTDSVLRLVNHQLSDGEVSIHLRRQEVGSLTLYRLGLPFASPTWTIHEGQLVMGLYPQVVAGACHQISAGEGSILDNEQFTVLRDRMNGTRASALHYVDVPQSLGDGYQTLLMISQIYLGFADMFDLEVPPLVIPPLHAMQAHVTPAGAFSYSDDAGWHSRATTPFPGAEVAGDGTAMLLGQQSMMVGMLLPALRSSRSAARQMETSSRLRGIYQSMVIYAQDTPNETYPPDLATLVERGFIKTDHLIASTSSVKVPPDIEQWPVEQRAEWIEANSSFHFIAYDQKMMYDPEQIVGFTYPHHGDARGISIVFDDGHVEFHHLPKALDMVDKRSGKTIGLILQDATIE